MLRGKTPKKAKQWCLWGAAAFLAFCLAVVASWLVLFAAAVVGFWFLSRCLWRKWVDRSPRSGFVKWAMGLSSLARKVLAGALCTVFTLFLATFALSATDGLLFQATGELARQGESAQNTEPSHQGQAFEKHPDSQSDGQSESQSENSSGAASSHWPLRGEGQSAASSSFDYDTLAAYSGDASIQINGGIPYFSEEEIQYAENHSGFEFYGNLDALGRCTAAVASVGADTMPAEGEERGDISQVKPSGWHFVRYDSIVGGSLYNRCHLVGWQLGCENANERNLVTGTRYMNVDGMLAYEDDIADYVRNTGNHVLYRVTPVFVGDELVARGVLMEARSVEDGGFGLSFCVWCYNVQPGITIDYATGDSKQTPLLPAAGQSSASSSGVESGSGAGATSAGSSGSGMGSANASGSGAGQSDSASGAASSTGDYAAGAASSSEHEHTYILNANTGKFHLSGCASVKKMKESNKREVTATRSEMIAQGYSPCANCNP